jgi:hypothetical protein
MQITTEFTVAAPIDRVWPYMLNVEKVAQCAPGAQLTGVIDDRTYEGKIGVQLGPIHVNYKGKVHIEEIDEQSHRIRMRAEGTEAQGRGGATATVTTLMQPQDGKTVVKTDSDIGVTGLVAQFGRTGIMRDVANRLARQFASCLEGQLQGNTSG